MGKPETVSSRIQPRTIRLAKEYIERKADETGIDSIRTSMTQADALYEVSKKGYKAEFGDEYVDVPPPGEEEGNE